MSFRHLYEKIKTIKLQDGDSQENGLNSDRTDIRWKCIQTLMKTELNYVTKIQDLLILMHSLFEKFSFRSIISKTQLSIFYQHLPIIFDFHYFLRVKLNEEIHSSQLIGKCFVEFLVNPDVFDIYLAYINNVSVYSSLCQQIRLNESSIKYPNLSSLESVIMMPIQRFPQLQLVIGDIYKNTNDDHADKLDLYKTICLIRSMSMCLDLQQKYRESSEISELGNFMKRMKITIKSQKVISKNCVFYLKPDFSIPRKLIKLPYYLILCDKEIIMYPRDPHLTEIPQDMMFYYSMNEINFQIKNLFNFTNPNKAMEIQIAKELFPLIKDSFSDKGIIVQFEEIIHDYNIIGHIYDDVRRLNFSYNSLEQSEITRTLLKLEKKMCEKERELNNYFDSLLNLKIAKTGTFEDIKIFQFDSSRQTNEWKINFYRTKLLLGLNVTLDWIPVVIGNRSISNNILQEFPLLFDPFLLNENGIVNIKCNVVKCQIIVIDVGSKISRCLWLSMSDGSVVILHFNDKAWTVLESFPTKFTESISYLCNVRFFDSSVADISLDCEMWMSCKNQIISYSLEGNQRPRKRNSWKLPSDIIAMCQVENQIFVGQQSLKVFIYSKKVLSRWIHESTMCLQMCLSKQFDELRDIVYGDSKFVYFVFKKRIAVFNVSENLKEPITIFTTTEEISCFYFSSEGIWLSLINNLDFNMYDKTFKLVLQKLSFPTSFFGNHSFESITSILLTDKYMWLGTKNGFIIIVSIVDRLSCIDSRVTVYISSKFSEGPIDFLLPFQSIHGISLKTKFQADMKRNVSDIEVTRNNKRPQSTPPILNRKSAILYCSANSLLSEDTKDEVDYFSNSTLNNTYEYLKNSTPMLILALGKGLLQFTDFNKNDDIYPTPQTLRSNEQSLFTFLE